MTTGTVDRPLFVKLVVDDDNKPRWGNILVMLGVTILSGWLASQSQRAGANPDATKQLRMKVARAEITIGHRLQRVGRSIEDAGWTAYESAR